MECPRDGTDLTTEQLRGIEVDRCSKCSGIWLDLDELDKLEATTASTEEERRATVMFGPGDVRDDGHPRKPADPARRRATRLATGSPA